MNEELSKIVRQLVNTVDFLEAKKAAAQKYQEEFQKQNYEHIFPAAVDYFCFIGQGGADLNNKKVNKDVLKNLTTDTADNMWKALHDNKDGNNEKFILTREDKNGNLSCLSQLCHRIMIIFHSDKLLDIARMEDIEIIANWLNDKCGAQIGTTKNWYELNKQVFNYLKENVTLGNDYNSVKELAISSCAWQLKEYIKHNLESVLLKSHNVILYGAPGTGKTYLASHTARLMANAKFQMVQFHPSYDYSDFVEGLRPEQNSNGQIGFVHKDGVFKSFCEDALKHGYKRDSNGNYCESGEYHINEKGELEAVNNLPKYVFIIDEINRGEMSKIFGELFFSLDPGYRGIKGKIQTQYANMQKTQNEFDKALNENIHYGHFFVPENVYIIGTMNDIDRSVESMDFAMRRRFVFEEVSADSRISMWVEKGFNESQRKEATNKMQCLNYAIECIPGLSKAFHVGPSYYLRLDENKTEDLWESSIGSLLYEYLRGMPHANELLDCLRKIYDEATLLNIAKKKEIENKIKSIE